MSYGTKRDISSDKHGYRSHAPKPSVLAARWTVLISPRLRARLGLTDRGHGPNQTAKG